MTSRPTVPQLESLAPRYVEEHHGTYAAILERAITAQPDIKNIALAGTYGTGKSSVLNELARRHPKRVIEVSLLTLGTEEDHPAASQGNPAAATKTNRIQKEIVKQLLYQQRPKDAPESRFRRISRFRWDREILVALLVGFIALTIAVTTGLDAWVAGRLGATPATLPAHVRTGATYIAIIAAPALTTAVARLLLQGRLGIEKVSAGPATINLPPRSTSYFDEYLDEIIYFFETNPSRDIVILEDLDRFDDPRIFESLRSLNGTLNAARQLNGRNVRFIYAVRDSVFERLGRDETPLLDDEARAEVLRANRTKFFDLVVPVVPFITHRNARDLMKALLAARGHTLPRELIDLAARHVADMRLIHNIINEYEVFKHRLLDVATPVPELDAERLFGMILFKNAHMGDFEAIRHGASTLDRLYDTWRALVAANLSRLRREKIAIQERIDSEAGAAAHARMLAQRLRSHVNVLADAPGSGLVGRDIYLRGHSLSEEQLRSVSLWRDLVDEGGYLSVMARAYYSGAQEMQLSLTALAALTGSSLDLGAKSAAGEALELDLLEQNRRSAAFLRRHSWGDLAAEDGYAYAQADEDSTRTFRQWVTSLMPSQLAADLVLHGYITSYFSLHVSSFYGQLIRPDAMTYVMRNVDRGVADADYPLTADDVDAILADQGPAVLNERSMLNVSILDHLLSHHPQKAAVIAARLVEDTGDGRAFIDHYVSTGERVDAFIATLVRYWADTFVYLCVDAPLAINDRAALLDTALAHQSRDVGYTSSPDVAAFVERAYEAMPSLTRPASPHAGASVSFVVWAQAQIPSVTALSDEACQQLVRTRSYTLTAENMQRLAGTDNIALDRLKDSPGDIYNYAMEELGNYLDARESSPSTDYTVETAASFKPILNDARGWTSTDYSGLITRASPACTVVDLGEVPHLAWRSLLASQRAPATFRNVVQYLEHYSEMDSSLASLLSHVDIITDVGDAAQEDRDGLALTLVNASSYLPESAHRVALAQSLAPSPLQSSLVTPESGALVGLLLQAGLLEDTQATFSSRLITDFETLERAVSASERFADFIGPDVLPVEWVAALLRSDKVDVAVKKAAISRMSEFAGVRRDAWVAVADLALGGVVTLSALQIETLRAGGVNPEQIIKLLHQAAARVSIDEVRGILRGMAAPYSVVADRGSSRPKLLDFLEMRAVLERLRGAEIVSKVTPIGNAMLRVTLKQP